MPEHNFSFKTQGMAETELDVLCFNGEEELGAGYAFDLILLAKSVGLEERLLDAPGHDFFIKKSGEDEVRSSWHGIASEVEYLGALAKDHVYRLRLEPSVWKLATAVDYGVFFDKKLDALLEDALKAEQLVSGVDFKLTLSADYPEESMICRYNESTRDFLARHMERLGAYSFIEQNNGADRLVIVDSNSAHTPLPQGERLRFAPASGLAGQDEQRGDEIIYSFSRLVCKTPLSAELSDYNTDAPDQDLTVKADVDDPREFSGEGRERRLNCGFSTAERGKIMANAALQRHICRSQSFRGQSRAPYLRPGYTFTLEIDPGAETSGAGANGSSYLLTRVLHQGSQAAGIASSHGLSGFPLSFLRAASGKAPRQENEQDSGTENSQEKLEDGYANSFACIPSGIQYRPERKTPWPRIHGMLNAVIDYDQKDQTAIMDEEGRYSVILPFGADDRPEGRRSVPLRLMQPHAGVRSGSRAGIHFPLQQGVEVLVAFIGGDPDRPIIAGALPNPAHPSPVADANKTQNIIATPGGHVLAMDDEDGGNTFTLSSPNRKNFIQIIE